MGRKRKYSSYQGEVGRKADNLIQQQFEASKPMEKCYIDVTEFAIPASSQKLYLSLVLDGFNSEIVAYNLSRSPNLVQVKAMLEQVFTETIMKTQFSIATKDGNINMISIIIF